MCMNFSIFENSGQNTDESVWLESLLAIHMAVHKVHHLGGMPPSSLAT